MGGGLSQKLSVSETGLDTRSIAQHKKKRKIRLKYLRLGWSQGQLGHMLVKFLNSSFEGRKKERKMKGFRRNKAVPISGGPTKIYPPQQVRAMNQDYSKTISQALAAYSPLSILVPFQFRSEAVILPLKIFIESRTANS